MADRPLRYRDLRRTLRRFGVNEAPPRRGRGSHRMFVGVVDGRVAKYPVPCHNEGDELARGVIGGVRRRFNLIPEHGVTDEEFYRS